MPSEQASLRAAQGLHCHDILWEGSSYSSASYVFHSEVRPAKFSNCLQNFCPFSRSDASRLRQCRCRPEADIFGAPYARRHLHQLLDLPLRAPGLVKMKMETACVDWPSGESTVNAVAAAVPTAAAAPEDLRAVLG